MSGSLGELHRHSNGTRVNAPESTSAVSLRVLGLPGGPNATSSFRGERQHRPRGTCRTCADGLHRRHNKGRPGSTRLMHWVPGRPESATMATRSNVAQAYRPIGAKNRFQSCLRLRCGAPLDRTVVPA